MKRVIFILGMVIVLTTWSVPWSGQNRVMDASSCAVDHIIDYYEAMAQLEDIKETGNKNYEKKLAFFKKNRSLMVSKVAQSEASYDLGDAHQVLDNMYRMNNRHLGYSPAQKSRVIGPAYFDARTGHRYVREDANSYAEFARNGEFIKMVPASLNLLNKSLNIYPITAESYIMYEKYADGKMQYRSLPGSADHPEGWRARRLMVSME